MEAPSGYGKTTAVRDYFQSELMQPVPLFWYTAAEEPPSAIFRRFFLEIEKIDPRAGARLLKAGQPNTTIVGEACDAMRSLECTSETYLVIDDFQYMAPHIPQSFFSALIDHGGANLHIIIITQILPRNLIASAMSHGVFLISAPDLRFCAKDILQYYSLSGADISQAEAQEITRYTEGWIAAIYLQLCVYRDTGTISEVSGIMSLMEHLVWEKLTAEQQTFLLRMSPFGRITLLQACDVCGWETLPDYALEALSVSFIRYDSEGKFYELHNILSSLLIQKRIERGTVFNSACILAAGDYYRDDGNTAKALDFYARTGDFERMLKLDLSSLYFETIGTKPFYELALNIADECPLEVKLKYPLATLQIAYVLLSAGMNEKFKTLLDKLRPALQKDREEASRLLGEWTLLSSFLYFPNLDEMTSILKNAAELFRGECSRIIKPDAPWCYSIYAPILIYHTTPGEAEREAEKFEEYIGLYTKLTGGHGTGADVLFRAELARYRRNRQETEILAYKAIYIAQSKQQKIIQLAATLHLAEIALEKNSTADWRHAVDSFENVNDALLNIFVLQSALDTAQGMLLCELGKDEEIAKWLQDGHFSGTGLLSMEKQAEMLYLGALLRLGKYEQLVGTLEGAYPEGIRIHTYQDVFTALIAAAGYFLSGHEEKACVYVELAVKFMLPDGLIAQLLYYSRLLDKQITECIRRNFPENLNQFEAEKKAFFEAYSELYDELSSNELPDDLTVREREVAALAASGFHNSEIANELFISESTVRAHMRTIFQKLDIDRRAKLADKLK